MDPQLKDKILKNANELMEESKILYDNKKYKRAFFLIYTAIEEIIKIKLITETNGKKYPNHHDKKIGIQLFQKMMYGILSHLPVFLKNELKSGVFKNSEFSDEENVEYMKTILANFEVRMAPYVSLFSLDATEIRMKCLYIDKLDDPEFDDTLMKIYLDFIYNAYPDLIEKIINSKV